MIPNFNNCSKFKPQFTPETLPSPAEYYATIGLKLNGSGKWKSALCPFHEDTKPSLRINIDFGGFKCMACNEHGGDILSFHMKKYGMSFKNACKSLGAWGNHG
jgi:DNA primase